MPSDISGNLYMMNRRVRVRVVYWVCWLRQSRQVLSVMSRSAWYILPRLIFMPMVLIYMTPLDFGFDYRVQKDVSEMFLR